MGLYDRDYTREFQPTQPARGPKTVVGVLIAINVAFFLADSFLFDGNLSSGRWVESESPNPVTDVIQERRVELPGGNAVVKKFVHSGGMVVRSTTPRRPLQWWRFLTYGFAHDNADLWHLGGNMMVLFFFGRTLEQTYGSNKFLAFYLTSVILGGIGFAVRHQLFGGQGMALGASGATFAIIVLFALKYPRATVLLMFAFPVPAWVLGVVYMASEVIKQLSPEADRVAHDIHLIGGVYGYIFFTTAWELTQILPRAVKSRFGTAGMSSFSLPKRRPKIKIYDPESRQKKLDADADRILAKLHSEGEQSLSAKERKTLEEYSRRMRQKRQ